MWISKQGFWLAVAILGLVDPGRPSFAQLVPDTSLGAQSSTLNTLGSTDTVNGGARVGINLFHSFLEFNVQSGRSLYFTDPGVTNILTRVTGANSSSINGQLGVLGNANLFLINPNGIVFGANSSLDIRGSFTATTANTIKFSDGSEFSTTNLTSLPVLTISVPIGLQRGPNQIEATIANYGDLAVGKNLTLDADRLNLQGSLQAGQDLTLQAQNTLQVRDSTTKPFQAIAGGNVTLQGDRSIDILALSHPQHPAFVSGGTLSLMSDGIISGDARFVSQGNMQIRSVSGGLATFTSLYDPIITTAGDVNLALNYSGASLLIEAGGNIRIQGTVNITSPDAAAPFVGDDAVLNSRPGLILRSGQSTLRYASNSGTVAGSTTGTGLVTNPGITLGRNVTIASGGVVRLTSGSLGDLRTQAITAPRGTISLTSDRDLTTNGRALNVGTSIGNAGAIQLTARNGTLATGDLIASSTDAANFGNGGAVAIASRGAAILGSIYTSAETGEGADLNITAGGDVRVRDIISYSYLIGNSGNVAIRSGGAISVDSIDTSADGGQSGNATLTAANDLTATKFIDTSTYGNGQGGQIVVQAGGNIWLSNGAGLRSDTFTNGNAGSIEVSGRSLFLENGAQIRSVSRYGAAGNSGNVTVNVTETTRFSGVGTGDTPSAIFTLADVLSTGNGGDITLNTGSLIMRDGSEILANHFGDGTGTRAGNITIRARDMVSLEGFRVRTGIGDSPGTGIASNLTTDTAISNGGINRQGGTIDIQAGGLELRNGAYIATTLETGANGKGGNIRLDIGRNGTPGDILIAGSATRESAIASGTNPNSIGNGGNLEITAGTVSLQDNAIISAEAKSSGNGGSIRLNTTNLSVGNRSAVTVETKATGNAGEINLSSDRLTLISGGQIRAKTLGQGNAGDIQIQAEAVTVTGAFSGIISGSGDPNNRGGIAGDGGDIKLTTETLRVLDNGILSASTFTAGQSGNIYVTANEVELANRGQLSATTEGRGNAGSITVNARDRITISGAPSGIFASTGRQSSGNGGSIFLTTGSLLMQDRARVTVDSQGQGNGGNIQLSTNRVDLINQSRVFAETASTQGGNIQIQARDLLLLRNQSLISASAGTAQAGGDGGNITINAGFVVGVLSENSDITANAFTGNGGQVNITAQGIFGLQFQSALTPRSDITATSRFGINGTVTLNTPNIDPSQGLVPLASNFADSANQIAQTCSAQHRRNNFVVLGRGGLSPDPTEALNQTTVWTDGQEKRRREEKGEITRQGENAGRENSTPNSAKRQQARASAHIITQSTVQNSIVEATNWIWNADGSISLITDNAAIAVEIANLSCHSPAAD